MKKQNIKFLLALFISMLGTEASAHDVEGYADGQIIYYKYINNNTELEVTYRGSSYNPYSNEYTGNVVIPATVTYNGTTYSVTSIGNSAFAYCSGLTSVTIPNSVTIIVSSAFAGCSGLTSVTIPNSVTSIGGAAFADCSGLTSVTIPNSVTSIGLGAFSGCSGLTSVTIPNSVTSIGDRAFSGCSGLTNITIPNSVTSIGGSAFRDCSSLKEVYINATNCTSMGVYVFAECSALTKLSIGDNVKNIPDRAFSGCSGLTSVTIPNSVTSIGLGAFSGCSGLTSVTIGNSVTSIGDAAFLNCSSLKEMYFNATNCTSMGYDVFANCSALTKLSIGDNVKNIPAYAFSGCSGLTSVTIGNSVTSIGWAAFSDCSSLESVTIGSGVLSVASNAFYGNKPKKVIWLTNTRFEGCEYVAGEVNYVTKSLGLSNQMIYPHLSSMFEVGGIKYVPVSWSERTCDAIDCTYDPTIDDIEIGEAVVYKGVQMNVNEIKPYTLCNNHYVKKATIGCSVGVPGYMFSNCSKLENIDILNTVTTIGDYAFDNCSSLKKITIPQSVTKLGLAFNGCTSLKDVYIADRNTVLTLGSNGSSSLFSSCPLDSVYIGGNISFNTGSSYGYSPFYGNTSLRTVVITDKETEISANEFYGCTNLQTFVVGNGVTTLGDGAFYGCSSLKSLSFGSQLQTIGENAFFGTSITEINSLAATPPVCGTNALNPISKWDCMVHVPENSLADYQAADQWKEFVFIYGDAGSGETPHVDQNALVISEAGVATYCPTVDVDFTTLPDLKAYIASGFNRETGALTMTRVYDVPAGTGLVVKGPAGIHEVPQIPSASIYNNLLRGSTVERNLSASAGGYVNYVLGKIGDEVGFCLVPAEGMTLAAGRSYLAISGETAASRSALKLRFDDEEEATGVSDVERQENGVSTVYDLQGRRVEQPRSGLYIRGGKKVIIK